MNSIAISYSTCQKEEKECILVKLLIYAVLSQFQICRNLRTFFRQISIPKISELTKNCFFQDWEGGGGGGGAASVNDVHFFWGIGAMVGDGFVPL